MSTPISPDVSGTQTTYLTIRSGYNDFSELSLNSETLYYTPGQGKTSYGMAAILNSSNNIPEKIFLKSYWYDDPNLAQNMNNDLENSILVPARAAGRTPVVIIWSNHAGGNCWASSPDFIAFLQNCGAGAALADINQQATQLGSADMLGIGYILVRKWGTAEIFEVGDVRHLPSASLSLQLVQVEAGDKSYISVRDDLF